MGFEDIVEDAAFSLIRLAVTDLPADVKGALERACRVEVSEIGRAQLGNVIKNFCLAGEGGLPLCQDTGLIEVYVWVGDRFGSVRGLEGAFVGAVRRATERVPLRPNAVEPFTRVNSGDNTGRGLPRVVWGFVEGDGLEIAVVPKGGGGENVSRLGMLGPTEGVAGVKRFVVDAVVEAGARPCPPVIVGVGVGGSADQALGLAKRALLRPLDEPNPEARLAGLEEELLELINATGIGPMGLGGSTTALGVRVDWAHCHTASLPVGVVFQCWAARRARARIHRDGRVEYLSHGRR